MYVVALVSQKGGSGKTTLCGHLAVEAGRIGDGPVAVIDTDPQGSLAAWWNIRQAPEPRYLQTTVAELKRDLDGLAAHGVNLTLIDTPSALVPAIEAVVKAADLVMIPSRPSPHDVRVLSSTAQLVEHLGKPLVFVINSAVQRARITTETIELISAFGPLAPTSIGQRTDFAASMIDGRTVMELTGRSRSAEEIATLWRFTRGWLTGTFGARQAPQRVPIRPEPDVFAAHSA